MTIDTNPQGWNQTQPNNLSEVYGVPNLAILLDDELLGTLFSKLLLYHIRRMTTLISMIWTTTLQGLKGTWRNRRNGQARSYWRTSYGLTALKDACGNWNHHSMVYSTIYQCYRTFCACYIAMQDIWPKLCRPLACSILFSYIKEIDGYWYQYLLITSS